MNNLLKLFMKVDIFGYLAAILTTAAFLPQLFKTLKTKKAEDVSLTTLVMFIIGVFSWIIYGYKISSTPILIANLITLILNLLILISKIYFSKTYSE
jgi:MtN3 and saliva related transmembrane protein